MNGIDLTDSEKGSAQDKYFKRMEKLTLYSKRERGDLKQWMEQYEFAKLQKWLAESKAKLGDLFEAGEIPVVGWKQLTEILKSKEGDNLEAELDQNTRESEQVAEQIRNLQEKQIELEHRKQQLQKIQFVFL